MLTQSKSLGFSNNKLGGHSSRSMMLNEMHLLVSSLPLTVSIPDFAKAIVDENILEKPTLSSRKMSLSHLVELYGLDQSKPLFRVFWDFAHADGDSLPQLCVVCAYARDPQLRYSFEFVRNLHQGEVLSRIEMEQHLENGFPNRFSPAMKKSMAQNVNTSWTFSGHLEGKVKKIRRLPEPRPVSAAYAMFAGYLTGLRGTRLLDSPYASLVSSTRSQLQAALSLASAKGLLSLKQAAGIVEFDFSNLLTPKEQELLHEPN
ncbi:MAG: hypothetical protein JZU70_09335 [Chlorobium sp.]|jgi:hypothetical protein|nr:hypothetical protein [Chlorobium sp.]